MEAVKVKKPAASAMEFVIDRNALLKALGHVQSVVEKRNTIPILSNVKLETRDGALHLTATDMDIAIVDQVAAVTKEEGVSTAPAHTLHDIIRKLPDGSEVELSLDEAKGLLLLQSGKSRFSLSCLPADDFPEMEGGEFTHEFSLRKEEVIALFDHIRFAMSTEETRYYLNGIYLHEAASDDTPLLRAVATDGHRLAKMEIALPAGASGMPGVIVPRKTVLELRKLVEESPGEVKISLSQTKIRFICGGAVLISKLIDGTFPDYERVIPKNNDKIMETDCKAFAQAVDRVSTISTEKTRAVKLEVENGTLTLTATSPEHGEASETVEVNYSADPLEIGFNSRYLLEMLTQIEGDTVQFVLADSSSPALVRDSADVGALYVIMPMRV